MLAGQAEIVGACVSCTVTVKLQDGPEPEVAHVTVVVPTGKKEPDAGEQVIVPQEPVVLGAGYVTTAPHWFESLGCVMFAGQVRVQPEPAGSAISQNPRPCVAMRRTRLGF